VQLRKKNRRKPGVATKILLKKKNTDGTAKNWLMLGQGKWGIGDIVSQHGLARNPEAQLAKIRYESAQRGGTRHSKAGRL